MSGARTKTSPREGVAKPWTVLVFMVPSDDLEGFALDDIEEMQRVYPADRFNLAVQLYRPSGSDRFTLVGGQVVFEDDPPIATLQDSLASFLNWGFEAYGDCTYKMVVLWGHSYGVGLNLFSPRQDQRGFAVTPSVRTMVPRPPLKTLVNGHLNSYVNGHANGNGNDYRNGNGNGNGHVAHPRKRHSATSLSLADLATSLAAVSKKHGPIDLLGMDSCYMSSVETAYELKDVAQYLVASESWIRKVGWDYAKVFGALAQRPDLTPEAFGKQIVEGTDGDSTRNITLLELADINPLVERGYACVQHLLTLIKGNAEMRRALQLALADTSFLKVRQFVDLRNLVSRVKAAVGEDDTRDPFTPLDDTAKALIRARKTTGEALGVLNGVSIYYRLVEASIALGTTSDDGEVNAVVDPEEYESLAFVKATKWTDLVNALDPARDVIANA